MIALGAALAKGPSPLASLLAAFGQLPEGEAGSARFDRLLTQLESNPATVKISTPRGETADGADGAALPLPTDGTATAVPKAMAWHGAPIPSDTGKDGARTAPREAKDVEEAETLLRALTGPSAGTRTQDIMTPPSDEPSGEASVEGEQYAGTASTEASAHDVPTADAPLPIVAPEIEADAEDRPLDSFDATAQRAAATTPASMTPPAPAPLSMTPPARAPISMTPPAPTPSVPRPSAPTRAAGDAIIRARPGSLPVGADVEASSAETAPAASQPVAPPRAANQADLNASDRPVVESKEKATALPAAERASQQNPARTAVPGTATADPAELAAAPRAALPDAAPSMAVSFQLPASAAAATSAMVAPQAIAERMLDMTSDDLWIDQLARDIAATQSDEGAVSFRLMPRHLGRLDVAMRVDDEGVALKLETQNEATATMITAAQGRLVEDLRQQGVRVAGAEVHCTQGDAGRQSQQGQGRSVAHDAAHLIETETAAGRAETRDDSRVAGRRGRFA